MDVDYNSMPAVGLADAPETEEERRKRLAAAAMPPAGGSPAPPVKTPSIDVARPLGDNATMPPVGTGAPAEMRANALEPSRTTPGFFSGADEHPHAVSGEGMPPAFYAGNSEQPHKPVAQPANTMPPVGPQTKAYEDLASQPRPELHGWKRVLDTIGRISPLGIGREIEQNIPGTPGNYDARLAGAAMRATKEQGIEKGQEGISDDRARQRREAAPQHVGQFTNDAGEETEVSRDPNSGSYSTQGVGDVGGKEKPEDKKIDEYVNDQGKRVLTFQRADGSHYDSVGGKTFQKPEQDANKLAGEIEAQIGAKPTTTQYGGKTYPTVEAAQRAWGRAGEQIKNDEAAAGRVSGYEELNRGKAINVIRNGQLMGIHPNEMQAGDVMAPASASEHAMSKEAQFQEIHSGIDNLRSAIGKLDRPFTPEQIGKLTLAMRHTSDPTIFQTELESFLGTQQLTGPQEDLVIWLGHINERALSIRNIAGMGQGSDSMRAAIQGILPSVKSGSTEMMNKQLAAFENQVNKLEKGVPKMPGGGGGADNPLGLTPPGGR